MRIAQVAPLYESVPPRNYGGTERIVHYLTEELVRQGHDVTLFASGDSMTSAKLIPQCERSLRTDVKCVDPLAEHLVMIERVGKMQHKFDVIHFHIDYMHFPTSRRLRLPQLTTLHGRLDIPSLRSVYDEFTDMKIVSISNSQRTPLPHANWLGTVHHGLPLNLLRYTEHPEGYFAFLGRISPEKRVDRAIHIATSLGVPLKIAAKIDRADRDYYNEHIAHLLDHPLVEYLGEIGEDRKSELLGNARALLFPIDWPEPFGLVMIEAMACGTPVIAMRCGSVPEVIDDGITGFVVDSVDDAVKAASNVSALSRARVREVFEQRFCSRRMTLAYVQLYRKIAGTQAQLLPLRSRSAA
jgi:glycosyltransferase involved in cell wall biosynthesis